jgi:hypothetical protein
VCSSATGGGWQSAQSDFKAWSGEAGQRLLSVAGKLCTEQSVVISGGAVKGRPSSWQVAAWANVNREGMTAGRSELIYPKTGMMLIFPSWLQHSVMAYTGTGTRISIAFNLSHAAT